MWSREAGRTLVLSWSARHADQATFTPWADIAAGFHDSVIDDHAQELKDFGAPVFFIWDHEPERWVTKPRELPAPDAGTTRPQDDPDLGGHDRGLRTYGAGTVQDFVDAFRHVRDRFEADGVTNVMYVLTLMARTFGAEADAYYPGDQYADLLGADGYSWGTCESHPGPWRSFRTIFQAFRTYAVAKGKQMLIPEYGMQEDPANPDRKAKWFMDMAETVKAWPELKGLMYFHAAPIGGCTWWVDTSPQSLGAFIAVGADPYMAPPVPTTQPVASIWSAPPPLSSDATANFTYGSDPGSMFRCSLDYATPSGCEGTGVTYSGLAEGHHTFSVQAFTTDALAGGDAAFWNWTVDIPPTTRITQHPANPTTYTFAMLAFKADQPGSTFTCELDSGPQSSCTSPVTYDDLELGSHSFSVTATDPGGNIGAPAVWVWTVASPTVTATDSGFSPPVVDIAQGQTALWSFTGTLSHTVTDATGLRLFKSGQLQSGSEFAFPFSAAGSYRYEDRINPNFTGIVRVPVRAPPRGAVGMPFAVGWASASPPADFIYDVAVSRPGQSGFELWQSGTTATDGSFTPDVAGTYRFKARLRRLSSGAKSAWSSASRVIIK